MKRPNILLYGILGFFVKVFALIKGQKIKRNVKIKAPCIVLSNHTSFPDFAYTTSALYPKRINYLGADKFFYDPVLGKILKLARAIPKCLFQADPAAILKALKVLKKGGIIGIFPEGQISPIGVSSDTNLAIGKLLKKAQVDVYMVKHKNAYLVNPPWTKKSFRGRVETEVDLIVSAKEIKNMSVEELNGLVAKKLMFNTYSYNADKKQRFHLNDITNLESVIYRCPSCGGEKLKSTKHSLICPDCGSEFNYDNYGQLNGLRLDKLYYDQEKNIQAKFNSDPNYKMTADVKLESYRGKRVECVGKGQLELNRKGYYFAGEVDGKPTTLKFDPEYVSSLPTDFGINIQIYKNYILYQFVFDDVRLPTQFVIAGEYIHSLSVKSVVN